MGEDDDMTEEDAALWRAMTGDVERFEGRAYRDGSKQECAVPVGRETAIMPKKPVEPRKIPGEGLDRRTEERLRKGQMPIDATLDLHGMRQDEAHAALTAFIAQGFARGHRCVLVITGKGKTGKTSEDLWEAKPGILKRRVPDWLADPSLNPKILKTTPAQPKHGGEGALYVLLRRNRGA